MEKRRRFPHKLKPNLAKRRPSAVVVVSIQRSYKRRSPERVDHGLSYGYALYASRWAGKYTSFPQTIAFDTADAFWSWLYDHCHSRARLYIVAERLLEVFSVLGGWKRLPADGWERGVVAYEENVAFWDFRRPPHSLRFLDIHNILREYHPVGDTPQARTEHLWAATKDYLGFLDEHEAGSFAVTVAGQAWSAYRHKYMTRPIFIHTDREAQSLEDRAYYGGRNECWRLGNQTSGLYYLLDVNSMYGACMSEGTYPTAFRGVMRHSNLTELERELHKGLVVADVVIKTDVPIYPMRIAGGVYYPVGRYPTTLADPELRVALKHGHIAEVGTLARYDGAGIFTDYISHYYGFRIIYRDAGMPERSRYCKAMCNSLYGKFGQRKRGWEAVAECDPEETGYRVIYNMDGTQTQERQLLGKVEQKDVGTPGINAFLAIAACVTSAARVRLWNYIELASPENVLYLDTDSLLVNAAGYERLVSYIDEDQLGSLKLVEVNQECEIRNLKNYQIGERKRLKGIPRSAVTKIEDVYSWTQGPGLAHMIHSGELDMYWSGSTTKTLRSIYKKGVVTSDRRVLPFSLPFARSNVPMQFGGLPLGPLVEP